MRVLPFLLLVLALPAAAQTDPCPDATTTIEIGACLSQVLQAEDTRLNTAYRGAMAMMAEGDTFLDDGRAGGAAALRDAQRAWIAFRDAACVAEGFRYRGGTAEGIAVASCLIRLTRIRTGDLLDMQSQT